MTVDMEKSLKEDIGGFSCPISATMSAKYCTVYALFLRFCINLSIPDPSLKLTIETRSQALSMAKPAP